MLPGVVRVFSGSTSGSMAHAIYSWRKPANSGFGLFMAAGDLDLDGVQDLLIATARPQPPGLGVIEWRSLRDGSVVTYLYAPGTRSTFLAVTIGAPQPGSPFPVIAAPEPTYGYGLRLSAIGRLNLLRAAPAGVKGLGPACAGRLQNPPQIGLTDLGAGGLRIHLSNAPPNTAALFLVGLSNTAWLGNPLPLGLGPLGLPGCNLFTSIDVAPPVLTGTTSVNAGYAFYDIPIPLGAGRQITLNGQWLVANPGATTLGALSGGLSWQH